MKKISTFLLAALVSVILTSCAASPFVNRDYEVITSSLENFSTEKYQGDLTGLTLHYFKSNLDGSMPSEIYIHYPSNGRSESFKIYPWSKEKKEVYLIVADYDFTEFRISHISGNFVHSNGDLEEYTALDFNMDNEFRYTINGKEYPVLVAGHTPSYIFNFDLTDLNTMLRYLYPDLNILDIGIIGLGRTGFVYSGKVRITKDDDKSSDGSLFYTMGGEAYNGQFGTMVVDRVNGYITELSMPMPTTVPYDTFSFKLLDASYMSESEWRTLYTQKAKETLE